MPRRTVDSVKLPEKKPITNFQKPPASSNSSDDSDSDSDSDSSDEQDDYLPKAPVKRPTLYQDDDDLPKKGPKGGKKVTYDSDDDNTGAMNEDILLANRKRNY